jgi:hypothetical protein
MSHNDTTVHDSTSALKSDAEVMYMILGFHRNADEICALLGYYTVSNSKGLPFNAA